MKNNQEDYQGLAWVAFTDLMINLFFIMLVLYVLTYNRLGYQQHVTKQQLKIIEEVQNAVKELPREHFTYDNIYKRFSLVENIEFDLGSDVIKPQYIDYLLNVGRSVQNLIQRLQSQYVGQDIRYVVVIEGMASNDNYFDNFPLSYRRAWAVYKLWKQYNLVPDPSVCEIQISGSGVEGIGRFPPEQESLNQRILIHIVPKIGEIKVK